VDRQGLWHWELESFRRLIRATALRIEAVDYQTDRAADAAGSYSNRSFVL